MLSVNITLNRISKILGPLEGKKQIIRHENRIKDILGSLPMKNNTTACLILLPFKDEQGEIVFETNKDPKKAIRAGFATSGRLTQFITPPIGGKLKRFGFMRKIKKKE